MHIDPQRLKQLREQRNLSRDALADESNVSARQIARIEQSANHPTVRASTASRLAKAFGVTIATLAGDEPLPSAHDGDRNAHGSRRSLKHRPAAPEKPSTHVNIDPKVIEILLIWNGLSRRKLAREAGISERQLARIVTSKKLASVRTETSGTACQGAERR